VKSRKGKEFPSQEIDARALIFSRAWIETVLVATSSQFGGRKHPRQRLWASRLMSVISRLSSGRRKDRVSRGSLQQWLVNVRNEMTRPGACDNYSRAATMPEREREREREREGAGEMGNHARINAACT